MEPRFTVVAVHITTGAQRPLKAHLTEADAEAVIAMAVLRRGVEDEFYTMVPEEA